jgi:hypothetical protein
MFNLKSNIPLDKTIVLSLLIGYLGKFAIFILSMFIFWKYMDLFINYFDIFFMSTYLLAFGLLIVSIKGIGDVIDIIAEKKKIN